MAQEAEDTEKEKVARNKRLAKRQAAKDDLTTDLMTKALTLTLHMYIKATIVTII
jgi:hypothetical protein